MPAVFNKLGIRFTYPENWTLDESEALGGAAAVTVYSPGGSFWTVSMHPADVKPRELVRSAVKALRETYDEMDVEDVAEPLAGHDLVGADVNFYCLDLTNTAQVRAFPARHCTMVVHCQADDREFAQIEAVFRAMTVSLLQSLAK